MGYELQEDEPAYCKYNLYKYPLSEEDNPINLQL